MAFLKRAFRPFNGMVGNVLSYVVSIGAVGALIINHWPWAAATALGIVVVALAAAGARAETQLRALRDCERLPTIQRPTSAQVEAWRGAKEKQERGEKLSRKERRALEDSDVALTKRGFVEHLGLRLQIGHYLFDSLRWEGEEYEREWAEFLQGRPDEDTARKWLEGRAHKAIDDAHAWKEQVSSYLSESLDMSYSARFNNDAGLAPRQPPDSLANSRYKSNWQDHDLRMQRLAQVIEELSRKWAL